MAAMQMASKRRLKTPGPGTYNANVRPVTPCPPSFSMGAKWGELTTGLDWEPGPGSYAASAHRTRCRDGPAITIAPRTQSSSSSLLSKSDVPGPGSYNSDKCTFTRWRDPAYSIASRTQSFQREISPGPGAYSVISEASGPSFSMALGRKPPSAGLSDTPGPGSYSAIELLQRPRSPVISIAGGRESRVQTLGSTSPGPGAYNPARSPRGRAFTISCRKPARPIEESPGPGQYCAEAGDVHTHPRDPMVSIAGKTSSKGSSSAGFCTPGPGAYDPQKWAGSTSAFIISGRPHTRRRPLTGDVTPGPGSYFLASPPSTNYSSPSIKIAGKYYRPPPTPIPGPGAYSPRLDRDVRAITITSKKPSLHSHDSPGPANYFWDNKYYTNLSSPSISMGVRFPKRASELSPGPGAYTLPHRRAGPAFSMHSGSERYSFA